MIHTFNRIWFTASRQASSIFQQRQQVLHTFLLPVTINLKRKYISQRHFLKIRRYFPITYHTLLSRPSIRLVFLCLKAIVYKIKIYRQKGFVKRDKVLNCWILHDKPSFMLSQIYHCQLNSVVTQNYRHVLSLKLL